MRWLVVSTHLPYHSVTLLVVIPHRVNAPWGLDGRGVDAYLIVSRAHNELMTPVTEDVAHEARGSLSPVVCQRTLKRLYLTLIIFIDSAWLIIIVGSVSIICFLAKVTIPVTVEVLRHSIGTITSYMFIGHETDWIIIIPGR